MITILLKIVFTIFIIITYIAFMVGAILWDMQFKKGTSFFISDFMELWGIKIDDLYLKGKKNEMCK